MKEKVSQIKQLIKKLKATDRGRALLFFLGYFVFFIIVYIFIATSGKVHLDANDYDDGDLISFNVDSIKNNNYSYKYSITVDVNDYYFSGKRNNNFELLEYNDVEYFINHKSNQFFCKNDKWDICNNPNDFSYFVDIDNIIEIAENSTYISKTDYESGKMTYTYDISTTTLKKLVDDVDIDLDDKPNEIVFSTDEDGNVNSIMMNLNSYGKYKNYCKKFLTIEIDYDDFGNIDDIKNPIKE